jgi:hypothetical protein
MYIHIACKENCNTSHGVYKCLLKPALSQGGKNANCKQGIYHSASGNGFKLDSETLVITHTHAQKEGKVTSSIIM